MKHTCWLSTTQRTRPGTSSLKLQDGLGFQMQSGEVCLYLRGRTSEASEGAVWMLPFQRDLIQRLPKSRQNTKGRAAVWFDDVTYRTQGKRVSF